LPLVLYGSNKSSADVVHGNGFFAEVGGMNHSHLSEERSEKPEYPQAGPDDTDKIQEARVLRFVCRANEQSC
jgi:hypothetical protein